MRASVSLTDVVQDPSNVALSCLTAVLFEGDAARVRPSAAVNRCRNAVIFIREAFLRCCRALRLRYGGGRRLCGGS